ncbi:hypothetical protein COLO4_03378 [Corchorus olitorius]|uniref:Uncharacterized protein n=1 Tax=Corchorus olitorius TaxID=93759 RepID=A0A1R3KYX0_9ROSI|nr:hypothetical protein COLO4_03378 [Corchorus olitorius]
MFNEAAEQAQQHPIPPQISFSFFSGLFAAADEPLKCIGSVLYFLTCMIMSGFCIVAAVLSIILVYRTKSVYANLYGKSCT